MTDKERRVQVGEKPTSQLVFGNPTPNKVYLFLDTESETGSGAIKFASYDIKNVKAFIADYVMENEVNTAYFEIKEQEVNRQ